MQLDIASLISEYRELAEMHRSIGSPHAKRFDRLADQLAMSSVDYSSDKIRYTVTGQNVSPTKFYGMRKKRER